MWRAGLPGRAARLLRVAGRAGVHRRTLRRGARALGRGHRTGARPGALPMSRATSCFAGGWTSAAGCCSSPWHWLAATTLALGTVRPDAWVSLVLFESSAAGGRTLAGSARGLNLAPELRLGAPAFAPRLFSSARSSGLRSVARRSLSEASRRPGWPSRRCSQPRSAARAAATLTSKASTCTRGVPSADPRARRASRSRRALVRDAGARAEPEEESSVRTPFQRDRDRIVHSKPFRRLKGKTQVFIDPRETTTARG